MRTLQAGQGVGVLIDQHIQSRDAIYVDFFNRPAATTSASRRSRCAPARRSFPFRAAARRAAGIE